MLRAVLDTNVLISAQLSSRGAPALILDLLLSRSFRCYVSRELLAEYEAVLLRPRFNLPEQHVVRSIAELKKKMIYVAPRKALRVCSDTGDDNVVECALEARADYVVTGNLGHFPRRFQDIRFVTPRDFLTVLASEIR